MCVSFEGSLKSGSLLPQNGVLLGGKSSMGQSKTCWSLTGNLHNHPVNNFHMHSVPKSFDRL